MSSPRKFTPNQAVPLYRQIAALLIKEIQSGRLADGEKLPPERQMATTFNTSVVTLRKALRSLEEQGMLQRYWGSGNYVRARADVDNHYAFFRLEKITGGGRPHARVLDVSRQKKSTHSLSDFGQHAEAYRIRRLRYLDDIPSALEEIWLDAACVDQQQAHHLMNIAHLPPSLYQLYKQDLGIWIRRAEDRVSVAALPHWKPNDWSMATGSLCGFVERLAWAQSSSPIEFSRSWFDPHTVRYVSRIT